MIHGLLSRDFYHLNDRRIKHMLSKFSSWTSYTLSDPMFQAAGIQATPRSSYILSISLGEYYMTKVIKEMD